ncbi:flagellar hook protein FlgE [Anaeroarcus burkinensis]|uniref:flagellar hook protein FlgE n=1 Tax=Anaeroarcus burkinensis TaxID=82376 RepID=UPI0003F5FCEB|nr:flagellar hook-basal body complex protein [Anaeroarcus burkinensis]
MMMSMYSAVSGLKSQQTKLNVIGNNVANINTLGYKGQSVGFSDLLSQTISSASAASGNRGGTNSKQIGLGAQVASITTNMGVGSAQYTGNDTDAALSGAGMFIVQGGGTGKYQFTRAGNFGVDVDGNLVVNGMKVCGWNGYTVASDGTVTYSTQSDVEPINVFGTATKTVEKDAVAAATSSGAVVRGTLDSTAAIGATTTQDVIVYTSNGATPPVISGTTVTVTLTKATPTAAETAAGVTNKWTWATTAGSTPAASGTLNFDSSGKLITTGTAASVSTGTITVAGGLPTVPINLSSFTDSGTTTKTYGFADGNVATPASSTTTTVNKRVLAPEATTAAKLAGNLDPSSTTGTATTTLTMYDTLGAAHEVKVTFTKSATNVWNWSASSTDSSVSVVGGGTINFDSTGNVTSGGSGTIGVLTTNGSDAINAKIDFSGISQSTTSKGTSSVTVNTIDGYTAGTLQDYSIGTDGIVMGSYSNGQKQPLGELGLAVFTNPQGLEKIGENLYTTTTNSGSFTGAVEVGTNGAGGLTTGALEMSNVDLASEFSEMMITQRAYQANSKIITTSDTLLETLINMSR